MLDRHDKSAATIKVTKSFQRQIIASAFKRIYVDSVLHIVNKIQ